MGASNAWGYEKNRNFRPICRFISEMMQDRAIYSYYGGEQKRVPKPFPMTLSELRFHFVCKITHDRVCGCGQNMVGISKGCPSKSG